MSKVVRIIVGVALIVASFVIPGLQPWASFALRLLGSAVLSSAYRPKPFAKKPLAFGGHLRLVVDAQYPRSVIFGKAAVAGQLIYREGGTGEANAPDLLAVIALAGYPIDGFEEFWFNDQLITVGAGGAVTTGKFANKLWVWFRTGHETDAAFPEIAALSPSGWGAKTRRLIGIPAIAIRAKVDESFEGRMEPLAVVRGARLYDPRKDSTAGGSGLHRWNDPATWEWSDNPKLAELLYLRGADVNGVRIFGMGIPQSQIDLMSFATEATVCDEQVPVKAGGTIKRYTCNGVMIPDQPHRENLDDLVTASAGLMTASSGKWKTYAGVWRLPSMTLTQGNFLGSPQQIQYALDPSREMNILRGSFIDASDKYKIKDVPDRYDTVSIAKLGEKPDTIDLPFTTDHRIAQRIYKIVMSRANSQRTVDSAFQLSALPLEPGDTVYVNHPRYGLSNTTMRVVSWALTSVEDENGAPGLAVQLSLVEERQDWYAWNATTEEQDLLATASLPRIGWPPYGELPPTDLVIQSGVVVIDCRANERFRLNLTQNVSVTFANIPRERILVIEITQGGAFTITWPASVSYVSGTPYVPTPVAGAKDMIGLATSDAGTSWLLRVSQVVNPDGGSDPGSGNPPPPSGGTQFQVAPAPSPAGGFCFNPSGCTAQVTVDATPTGGTAPYTFLWQRIELRGGPGMNISSTTAQAPTFSVFSSTPVLAQEVWRVTGRDAAGTIAIAEVLVDLSVETGA